ncbi:hypothetical protein niasHT_032673 [Heterodera trifolii]|uniref:Uncharacterized protein n=1 Tax=Heterodera trifolii TaxID=157864 RepID=A0ABD2IRZ3_9BILA
MIAVKGNFVYSPPTGGAFRPKHCHQRHHRMPSPPSRCCAIILLILCHNLPLILPILFLEDDSSASGSTRLRHEDSADGQGRLDQHCLEQESALPKGKGCARDWRQWSEVCICEENLCNTWAFLRAQMDTPISAGPIFGHHSHRTGAAPLPPLHAQRSTAVGAAGALATDHSAQQQRLPSHYDRDGANANANHALLARRDMANDDDDGNNDPMGFGQAEADQTARHRRGPALILLLVVLPLVVGAFTVLLVFLNYHCNML